MNYERSPSLLGGILKVLAGAVIIMGVLAGIIAGSESYGFQWGVFFLYVGVSLTAGLFLASFAEIIFLLQTSCDKQHKMVILLQNSCDKQNEILMYLKETLPVAPGYEVHKDTVSTEVRDNVTSSVTTDISKITPIEFAFRPEDTLTCPRCHIMQSASHDACSHCGVTFVFRSEQKK